MGGTAYNFSSRSHREKTEGYKTRSMHDLFPQMKERRIHESMNPRKIRLREARDSDVHPRSFPIIFGMDVTGSMGEVPHMLIKEGLPKMISEVIQKANIESPSLLFLALGDSQNPDDAPLQVGQFESGDAEMDMWLTRTWPEGKGGGNRGESYLWAWYFAANHCVTDHWEKRGEKGVLITFGDEPCLPTITHHEMREVMDLEIQENLKADDLLKQAQEKWYVYHLQLTEHRPTDPEWVRMLGQNLIEVDDYRKIPETVAKICSSCYKSSTPEKQSEVKESVNKTTEKTDTPIIL